MIATLSLVLVDLPKTYIYIYNYIYNYIYIYIIMYIYIYFFSKSFLRSRFCLLLFLILQALLWAWAARVSCTTCLTLSKWFSPSSSICSLQELAEFRHECKETGSSWKQLVTVQAGMILNVRFCLVISFSISLFICYLSIYSILFIYVFQVHSITAFVAVWTQTWWTTKTAVTQLKFAFPCHSDAVQHPRFQRWK